VKAGGNRGNRRVTTARVKSDPSNSAFELFGVASSAFSLIHPLKYFVRLRLLMIKDGLIS